MLVNVHSTGGNAVNTVFIFHKHNHASNLRSREQCSSRNVIAGHNGRTFKWKNAHYIHTIDQIQYQIPDKSCPMEVFFEK